MDPTSKTLYDEWKSGWCKQDKSPGMCSANALHKAGIMFSRKPMPDEVRAELYHEMTATNWPETTSLQWLAFNNVLNHDILKDRELRGVLREAKISHRIALTFALLLDHSERKSNQRSLYATVKRWEPRLKPALVNVSNVVAELLRVWVGEQKASEWQSLVEFDRLHNNCALQLESYTSENMNRVMAFAFDNAPLRQPTNPEQPTIPDLTF